MKSYPAGLPPCICFVVAAGAAALDTVFVPLAFFKCIMDDTRLLLAGSLGDDGPCSQHARLLQVPSSATATLCHAARGDASDSCRLLQHARDFGDENGVPLIRFLLVLQ
jgi:hypothetical protein